MTEPIPQEVDDLLNKIYASEYDYWLEAEAAEWDLWVAEGGEFSMEQAEQEAQDRGWRQSDFV